IQRPVVVPRSLLPSVTTRRTRMGLIGSDTRLLVVTWSKLPAERPVSRMSRPVVLLSLVRAPAQPPQHAYFGSRSHTPSNRCLRFERRVAAPPARLAPVLLARLWTDQTCTGKLASASPIAPRIRLSDKTSRLHPRHVVPKPAQTYEPEVPVKVREGISSALASPDLVLGAQPPAQPHRCVGVERPIGWVDGAY